jgi:hypothetical protein
MTSYSLVEFYRRFWGTAVSPREDLARSILYVYSLTVRLSTLTVVETTQRHMVGLLVNKSLGSTWKGAIQVATPEFMWKG